MNLNTPTSAFDLASAVAKLRNGGLESLLGTLGISQKPSGTAPPGPTPSQQPEASGWLPGNPDFAGRDPWHPQYAGLTGQPSSEDTLITLHAGPGYAPPDTIQGEDGLYGANPMTLALKQRRTAGEEANRQAQAEETDAMVDEFSRTKARKDALQDQEVAERSAQSAANFEADMQARGAQRTTQKRGGFPRMGRGALGRPRS